MSTRVSLCAFSTAFVMLIASKTESMFRKQLLAIARAISHLKNHNTILILNHARFVIEDAFPLE